MYHPGRQQFARSAAAAGSNLPLTSPTAASSPAGVRPAPLPRPTLRHVVQQHARRDGQEGMAAVQPLLSSAASRGSLMAPSRLLPANSCTRNACTAAAVRTDN